MKIAIRLCMTEMLQRKITYAHAPVRIGILFAFKTETYNFHGVDRPKEDIIIIIIITTSNCNEYTGNWIQSKGKIESFRYADRDLQ